MMRIVRLLSLPRLVKDLLLVIEVAIGLAGSRAMVRVS